LGGQRCSESRSVRRRETQWASPKGSRRRTVHQSPSGSYGIGFQRPEGTDTNLIIAALLHDTIEDAEVTKAELVESFGADVADLVMEVTDDKSLPNAERKRLQITTAPEKLPRAQVIKLADKISNVRAIVANPPSDWGEDRKREYIEWAKQVGDGLSTPNPILKEEFERVYRKAGSL
jgi:GTP diphosphokinase / guanosine-3',5'-bis(diphosphate) 3'-diphosphatase